MLQLIIATLLFGVLAFGIGFIANMLIKTTWFPTYLIIIILVVMAFWAPWSGDNDKLIDNITQYSFVDFIPVIGCIIGAILSGYTIRALRRGGYKMF